MPLLLLELVLGLIAGGLPQDATSRQEGGAAATAAPAHEPTAFVRVTRDEDGTLHALQTSTVSYRAAEGGPTVDLIAVVHVGDASYYRSLDESFEAYDAVLYELVAEPDALPVPGRPEEPEGSLASKGLLSLVQEFSASTLGLTSQVERIDYTRANLVHADLSPSEMVEAWERRGENGLTLALAVFTDFLRQTNLDARAAAEEGGATDPGLEALDPFTLLLDPDAGGKVKRLLALELERQVQTATPGSALDALLVRDRNAAAMKVLARQLAAGKQRIAIFYGAAHMPDFERRLVLELGMQRERVEWRDAWDLHASGGKGLGDALDLLGDLLQER